MDPELEEAPAVAPQQSPIRRIASRKAAFSLWLLVISFVFHLFALVWAFLVLTDAYYPPTWSWPLIAGVMVAIHAILWVVQYFAWPSKTRRYLSITTYYPIMVITWLIVTGYTLAETLGHDDKRPDSNDADDNTLFFIHVLFQSFVGGVVPFFVALITGWVYYERLMQSDGTIWTSLQLNALDAEFRRGLAEKQQRERERRRRSRSNNDDDYDDQGPRRRR